MSIADKATVTRKFQQLGLEGLPARIYPDDLRPALPRLIEDFGEDYPLMVRTAATRETRNLPRLAVATPAQAVNWINKLPIGLTTIIQPYDRVVFSVELAVYGANYIAELVPGIWELGTNLTPAVVRCDDGAIRTVTWTTGDQVASFHSLESGYFDCLANVADWQISTLIAWEKQHRGAIARLGAELPSAPFGIKLHYAACFGLSPQNIRTNVPPFRLPPTVTTPTELVPISALTDNVPLGSVVLLEVSIAREHHAQLDELISRMLAAQVQVVYLRSGLLSHLAISLREAGLMVRRFDGSILRS